MPFVPEKDNRPLVCVVVGQTASGKSRFSLELARRLGGEIVSMDALKVYRGMDIGTAKPSAQEQAEIPHHMIDLVDPNDEFNVGMYLRAVEPAIANVIRRGLVPVVDCGTPMYLRAFLSGIIDGPTPDPELRAALSGRGSASLHAELSERDPVAANRLHPNDRRRVIRALEFALQTGQPISALQTTFDTDREDFRFFMTGPLWSQEVLHQRIADRIDRMLECGLIDEVSRILERGEFSNTSIKAIGYNEALAYINGIFTREDVRETMVVRTRQLARAQLKWFRRHKSVKWLLTGREEELRTAAMFCAEELEGLVAQRTA